VDDRLKLNADGWLLELHQKLLDGNQLRHCSFWHMQIKKFEGTLLLSSVTELMPRYKGLIYRGSTLICLSNSWASCYPFSIIFGMPNKFLSIIINHNLGNCFFCNFFL